MEQKGPAESIFSGLLLNWQRFREKPVPLQ